MGAMRSLAALLLAMLLVHCGDDDRSLSDDDTPDGAVAPDAEADAGPVCEPGAIPTARGEHATVADPARGRLLAYGGNLAFPVDCMPMTDITDEMWAFDLECGTWSQVTPIGGPGRRARHSMVTTSDGERAYLFGGRVSAAGGGYVNYADVWELDLATLTFTQVTTTGVGPEPRSHATLAHDDARDRLIVFGGNTSTSGLTITGTDDTWALDLETGAWSPVVTETTPPPPRYAQAGASDGQTAMYVFGGSPSFNGPFLNDVWGFDFATDGWRQVAGGGPDSPNTRFGAGLFLTGATLTMVAGHDSTDLGNDNDLWTLDIASGVWTEVVAGDVPSGAAAGFCDFPADFTTPDLDAPERRHYFGTAQAGSFGYVTMGKSDCGNVNDVWRVDLSDPRWELFGQASTAGEACNRSGATSCTTLCF